MRVLFDHDSPFFLAHGGFQTQIEQTRQALEKLGVQVEHLRWWDDSQKADVIHFFGRAPEFYIRQAHKKGYKLVMAELLTGLGSRSWLTRLTQRSVIQIARCALPFNFRTRMAWDSYQMADALIALTNWEAKLMVEVFRAPLQRIHVVPNAVEEVFFGTRAIHQEPWLICTATITPHKRTLELAEAAVKANTPVWVIGKPHHEDDPYFVKFRSWAEAHSTIVRFEGAISDRTRLAEIYRHARGFVLLSTKESLSLSALEASAAGCPLLLSDLPWARATFGAGASYCPVVSPERAAEHLRRFYDEAPRLPRSSKPMRWSDVAEQLKSIYERVLA